jgi:hypothetical protein
LLFPPALCSCYYIDYTVGDYANRQAACQALGGGLAMYQTIGEQVQRRGRDLR